MNDTCATHRSRVPRRSFGRVKWGVTTVKDERGLGLDFSLCFVCGSRPWGAAAFILCLFIWLLKWFKCSPVPASFFPICSQELCYTYIQLIRSKKMIHSMVKHCPLLRDAKVCCDLCLELFFVGKIEQKQAILCLRCKSLIALLNF